MTGLVGALVDLDGPVRDWVKTVPEVAALSGTRVFLELPSVPVYPVVHVVGVVAGSGPAIEPPVYAATVQIDIWADTRAQASALAWAIANAANDMACGTAMGLTVVALSATVARLPQYLPDPDSTKRRCSLDLNVFARSASD